VPRGFCQPVVIGDDHVSIKKHSRGEMYCVKAPHHRRVDAAGQTHDLRRYWSLGDPGQRNPYRIIDLVLVRSNQACPESAAHLDPRQGRRDQSSLVINVPI
jgi:hypothetical protein